MSNQFTTSDIKLVPFDKRRILSLCGNLDEYLRQIETALDVAIINKGNAFRISGQRDSVNQAIVALKTLYTQTESGKELLPAQVRLVLQKGSSDTGSSVAKKPGFKHMHANKNKSQMLNTTNSLSIKTPNLEIIPFCENQEAYIKKLNTHDINFGVGPAGTGKTFLAVACAVDALNSRRVNRIILTRPVVEAGERLGFLPGDLTQKIDPYLRPLYDALYEMLGFNRVAKLLEQQIIEIAPLAYMRGRTLNEAFIILDESQNTTVEQMKMFLTRIGFGSIAVITGDVTQVDLPRGKTSGLKHAVNILSQIKAISFTFFSSKDVVRHPLVQDIIECYHKDEEERKST